MTTWITICLVLCLTTKIHKTYGSVESFLTLVESVQKFYLTPSMYLVIDSHEFDFNTQKVLFDVIRSHSRRGYMSQTLTYDDLTKVSKRRDNSLYALIIQDRENLMHAIAATRDTYMSAHPWLLYIHRIAQFDCNQPNGEFFKLRMDTRMSAMCEGSTILKKYYGIFENRTEVMDLAVWTPEQTLEFVDSGELMKARTNMKGITLRLARKDTLTDNIAKFNEELMNEVKKLCNFETVVTVTNNELGYLNHDTGEWYGMMKAMKDKLADIGLALFSMSQTRMKVVDYAIPLAKGRANLYARLPEETEVLWNAYFQVFSKDAWAAIGSSIIIFTILVYLMNHGFALSTHLFFEALINIWGIFSMQGLCDRPLRNSIRIAYFSILSFSVILNAIYSASITSYIAVLSPELPFSTYQEFLKDNSYEVAVVKGSREHSLMTSNQSQLSPLKTRLKNDLPSHSNIGFEQACQEQTAFYTDEVKFESEQNRIPCKLGAINVNAVEYMSFVMTLNSPYKNTINYIIQRLIDHGILKRMRDKYFHKYVELQVTQPSVISLDEICSILIIWTVGLIITLIGLIIEIIVFRFSLRSSTNGNGNVNFRDDLYFRAFVKDERWSNSRALQARKTLWR